MHQVPAGPVERRFKRGFRRVRYYARSSRADSHITLTERVFIQAGGYIVARRVRKFSKASKGKKEEILCGPLTGETTQLRIVSGNEEESLPRAA